MSMSESELPDDTKPILLQGIFSSEVKIEIEPASPESSEIVLPNEQDPVDIKINKHGGDPVFEQVFIHNPCYCECPLRDSVDWIAAFEFCWGLANAIVCIVTLAVTESENNLTQLLQQFADAGKRLSERQAIIIKITMILHIIESVLAWLLMVATDRRIRCLCLAWMICTITTMTCQIVLVSVEHFIATYIGVATHPIKLYFIYVVWALAKEIRTFPHGPPIPIVRQIAGDTVPRASDNFGILGFKKRPKKKLKKTAAIPILVPTVGWGYYPHYYGSVGSGFYSHKSPYFLHQTYREGEGAAAAVEESRPKTRAEVQETQRLSTAWSLDTQSVAGSADGVRGSVLSNQGQVRKH